MRTGGPNAAQDVDQIVSGAGAVVAVVLLMLGAVAIYWGTFGQDNVRDRLAPQNVTFPPLEAMTPDEKDLVGDFAGMKVVDGPSAEAFSDYIGLHLEETNEGKTYSETSSEARAEGLARRKQLSSRAWPTVCSKVRR